MIKKVAVNLSKVAERWAMKKPVRRIDQQLIVAPGRSLISGADMYLGRRANATAGVSLKWRLTSLACTITLSALFLVDKKKQVQ